MPAMPQRPPQANIPQTLAERERLRALVGRYVDARRDDARAAARRSTSCATRPRRSWRWPASNPVYRDYVGVLLNNEVWSEHLASVPFDRRLLLLPKCLRVEDKCPAPFDEFGLLCKQCGLCTIQDLQEEAERLGYAVLVAEGSALVMALIQSGKIDAIVGVSCLSVLERAFPYMEAAAIPGVAIPLLQDDCKDTAVDIDWVWNVVHLTSDDRTRRLDLDALRTEVETWFTPAALDAVLGPADGEADRVARGWLAADGKRWRPFLTACAYKALQDDPSAPLPESLRKAAVAVECFHKASLVHDDIEDADERRYGRDTLHVEHGVPVALNAGDLLVGEGYRLLAGCGAPPDVCAELVRIAAAGHRELCLGQGAELAWMRQPEPLDADRGAGHLPPQDVAGLSRWRSASAPRWRARRAETQQVLRDYSEALGIAYQIRDDLEDLADTGADAAFGCGAPSLLLALACDKAKRGGPRPRDDAVAQPPARVRLTARRSWRCSARRAVEDRARALLEAYKEQADSNAAGAPEREPQGTAAARRRQGLPRRDQGLVQ